MRYIPRLIFVVLLLASSSCSVFGNKPLTDEQIAELATKERDVVVVTIADEGRRDAFLELLDKRDRMIEAQLSMLKRHSASLADLNQDFHSSREQYSDVFEAYNRDRLIVQSDYVRLFEAMKAASTTEEWAIIAEHQWEYLRARRSTFRRVIGAS